MAEEFENRNGGTAYRNTMAALNQAERAEPAYSGSYDKEIKDIYEKIVNREGFKYEYSSDPVYGAYRDTYKKQGQLAMRDSMAAAANLTGGYASSYAQSVGQQQYGAYLEKLSALMPELYSAAYDRYKAEGDRLNSQFNAASSLADMEYSRYADHMDRQNQRENQAYQKQQDAYKKLADIIAGTGYVPSDEELEAGGMSRSQADALGYEFMRVNGLLPPEIGGAGNVNYYDLSPTAAYEGAEDAGEAEVRTGYARTRYKK